MTIAKFLGIVLTPANVQCEGLQSVFNNIEYVGASAIALDPWLLYPAKSGNGNRMPDLHIDGYARQLSRPLWGKHELFVSSFLAFRPEKRLYAGAPYQPVWRPLPAELDPNLPHQMINEAKKRQLQVFMGIAPFLPPEPHPEDRPVRVDGLPVQPPWIADNVCLNSSAGQHYALALIQDLLQHFPDIDGLILDWVEFGAYRLEDHFTCFCEHCKSRALEKGYDWPAIQRDVGALWNWLHAIPPAGLENSRRVVTNPSEFLELLTSFPAWLAFLRFKAESVLDFYKRVREQLDQMGREDVHLTARGWCPPWNHSSGMNYRSLAKVCRAVAPKFFTFDHAAIPGWVGQSLLNWNPDLLETEVLDTIIEWLNLADEIPERTLDHYHIPAPGVPHPARMEVYRQRFDELTAQINGEALFLPIAHPYLPEEQWRQMVTTIRESRTDGMWVNFYSYLSDTHLEVLRRNWPA